MTKYSDMTFTGERALYGVNDVYVENSRFCDGESPLKESSDIEVAKSVFAWKYPFWYSRNIKISNSRLFEMARAAVWYIDGICIEDTVIEAPKCIRRSKNVTLKNVTITNGPETLWDCDKINIDDVQRIVLDDLVLWENK